MTVDTTAGLRTGIPVIAPAKNATVDPNYLRMTMDKSMTLSLWIRAQNETEIHEAMVAITSAAADLAAMGISLTITVDKMEDVEPAPAVEIVNIRSNN